MFTKIALAAALTIGAACAALAAPDTDPTGGFREEGPGGFVTDGVNPVYHPSMRGAAGRAYNYAPDSASCARFKSYDPASGTYLGADGARHTCS
jgi:BA14K-like protein